jgi:hypothetical protein
VVVNDMWPELRLSGRFSISGEGLSGIVIRSTMISILTCLFLSGSGELVEIASRPTVERQNNFTSKTNGSPVGWSALPARNIKVYYLCCTLPLSPCSDPTPVVDTKTLPLFDLSSGIFSGSGRMYLQWFPKGLSSTLVRMFISLMVNTVAVPMHSCGVSVASPYCIEGVVALVIGSSASTSHSQHGKDSDWVKRKMFGYKFFLGGFI